MSTTDIAKLRELTGAGMLDCQKALQEAGGDIENAIDLLRKKGVLKAAKRADKIASEGAVISYIHAGGKIGVLLELNCETDFVAKTDAFKALGNDLAMHIAAAAPKYLTKEEVSTADMDREREVYTEQLKTEGKPADMIAKIVEGKMSKFYSEVCLLEQAFIKDESKTITQLLTEQTATTGEKLTIRRFARFALGEGMEKKTVDFAAEVQAQLQ